MTTEFEPRPSDIVIRVDGGVIQDVEMPDGTVPRVIVYDYDNGRDGDAEDEDEYGDPCSCEVHEAKPLPATPSTDWRALAVKLGAALEACTAQIHQMKGMFNDGDGSIAKALEDAEEVDGELMDACKADMDAAAASVARPGQDDRACSEGWGLFENSDTGLVEVQADHDSDRFIINGMYDDDAARAFVTAQAEAGSEYHKAALEHVGKPNY